MHRTLPVLLLLATLLPACATTGPRRSSIVESVQGLTSPSSAAPTPVEDVPEESQARARSDYALAASATEEPAPPTPAPVVETPKATPFSAGLMLGVGLHLDGSRRVIPAQLAVGSLKFADVKGRALNALALGGISSTSIQSARAAWGLGASFELTPGTLPYEIDVAAGALWVAGEAAPAGIVGFTLTPKM